MGCRSAWRTVAPKGVERRRARNRSAKRGFNDSCCKSKWPEILTPDRSCTRSAEEMIATDVPRERGQQAGKSWSDKARVLAASFRAYFPGTTSSCRSLVRVDQLSVVVVRTSEEVSRAARPRAQMMRKWLATGLFSLHRFSLCAVFCGLWSKQSSRSTAPMLARLGSTGLAWRVQSSRAPTLGSGAQAVKRRGVQVSSCVSGPRRLFRSSSFSSPSLLSSLSPLRYVSIVHLSSATPPRLGPHRAGATRASILSEALPSCTFSLILRPLFAHS